MTDPRHAEADAAHSLALLKAVPWEPSLHSSTRPLRKRRTWRNSRRRWMAKDALAEAEKSWQQTASEWLPIRGFREGFAGGVEDARRRAELEGRMYSLFHESSSVGAKTSTHQAGFEVVLMVRRLVKKELSAAIAQLASRISTVRMFGAGTGEDPFAKVKGVITDLFGCLQEEASTEPPPSPVSLLRCTVSQSGRSCGSRPCGSSAGRARWQHQGVQRRGSVRGLDGGSAEVGINVSSPAHKKVSDTRTTYCNESAHVLCVCALCTHVNWNKERKREKERERKRKR